VETIAARGTQEPAVKEERLEVKVPNLSLLPESPDYVKIGGRTIHLGPPLSVTDNNHHGTSRTLQAIQTISQSYRQQLNQRLRINDISLPWGGLFDIQGDWLPPHWTHREGRNVDVSIISAEGGTVNSQLLRNLVRQAKGRIVRERNPDHYHLSF
jgi:hypothetical protein